MLMDAEELDKDQETEKDLVSDPRKKHEVVIHLDGGKVIYGHIDFDGNAMEFFQASDLDVRDAITVRPLDAKEPALAVRVREIKAIFVVKSFRGNHKRKGLRFYSNGPAVGSIWAEIQFKDNEIIEGLIENSMQHLLGDGFLLKPSDPQSNNICIYVNKAAIASYRVLGVKALRETEQVSISEPGSILVAK
jgi:hypothetical protein